ncbi:hypothetical protein SLA2020_524380 [Shorea laevis]
MATATGASKLARQIGAAVKQAASKGIGWYGPHMAAASRAISERIPMVDLLLEVRDARIPLTSEYDLLRNYPSSARRVIVLNKMDLANRSQLKEWMKYFEQQNCISYGVNSHNKDNVKEFLNFVQARVRDLKKNDHSNDTITVMLLGIPNVGKSALANSMHQIGRISAAEKGKLRHATVSPYPGETKNISSLKIASHPSIYVLDTPGILPPKIHDVEACSKLALTGAIRDSLIGEKELAQYFLAILNLSDQYKKWAKVATVSSEVSLIEHKEEHLSSPVLEMKQKRQFPTDHTQDCIVRDVRCTLFETISCFDGHLKREEDLERLTEAQFASLRTPLHAPLELGQDVESKIAAKLLNLYRTGRLGHYTLDSVPTNTL